MSARVIAREFGVLVVDDAVVTADAVPPLLDEAIAMMRQYGKHAMLYEMANITLNINKEDAAGFGAYFAAHAPPDARVALVHFRDAELETLAAAALDVLRAKTIESEVFATRTDASAWLLGTAFDTKKSESS